MLLKTLRLSCGCQGTSSHAAGTRQMTPLDLKQLDDAQRRAFESWQRDMLMECEYNWMPVNEVEERGMTLSEIFYEAACRTSDTPRGLYGFGGDPYEFSCQAISNVAGYGCDNVICPSSCKYDELMDSGNGLEPSDVEDAAKAVGWHVQDYRTFMLLMAAEAVK